MAISFPYIKTSDGYKTYFIKITGEPALANEKVEPFTRPGINGVGLMKVGKRGEVYRIIAMRDASDCKRAAQGAATLIAKCQGQFIDIRMGYGAVYKKMICVEARVVNIAPALMTVGGIIADSKAVVVIAFDCLDTEPGTEARDIIAEPEEYTPGSDTFYG